jgi:hypothetical protein
VFNTLAERYRFKRITKQEGMILRGMGARQIVQYLGVPAWKLPLIARHARLLVKQDRVQIALFPGVDRMLTQLHATGILLAVVSSISEETVRHVLEPESAARITYYACGSSIFGKQAHVRRVLKRSGGRRSIDRNGRTASRSGTRSVDDKPWSSGHSNVRSGLLHQCCIRFKVTLTLVSTTPLTMPAVASSRPQTRV